MQPCVQATVRPLNIRLMILVSSCLIPPDLEQTIEKQPARIRAGCTKGRTSMHKVRLCTMHIVLRKRSAYHATVGQILFCQTRSASTQTGRLRRLHLSPKPWRCTALAVPVTDCIAHLNLNILLCPHFWKRLMSLYNVPNFLSTLFFLLFAANGFIHEDVLIYIIYGQRR